MEVPIVTESPVFAAGVFMGALLLVGGLILGIWLGRRTAVPLPTSDLEEYHLRSLLQGLSKWTNGFATDVSEYRQVVENLSEQFDAVPEEQIVEDRSSIMEMVKQLSTANDSLHERIENAESALKQQSEEIAGYMSEARTDKLTGLPNRRVLDDELPRRVAEWNRYQTPIAMMIIDVDFFKKFNDKHGHLAGDAVLRDVAQVIKDTVRESDLPVRMGGEEFAVILPGIAGEAVWLAAERARTAVEQHRFRYEDVEMKVTISCGAAAAIKNDTPTALIKRADEALYSAKRAGRNRSHWHDGRTLTPIVTTTPEGDQPPEGSAPELENNTEFGQVCLELRERLMAVINDEAH